MPHLPLGPTRAAAYGRIQGMESVTFSNLAVARVDDVDLTTKTTSISLLTSNASFKNVQYGMPYYDGGTGIIYVPAVGSLCVVGFDSYSKPTILSFVPPTTFNTKHQVTANSKTFGECNFPDLVEGELLLRSSGKSFIKLDKIGGLLLSSALLGYIYLDDNGNAIFDLESLSYSVNGVNKELYTHNFNPYMEITKGMHNLNTGINDENTVELVYSVQNISNQSFIGFDSEGNIHLSGKVIQHEGGNFNECK